VAFDIMPATTYSATHLARAVPSARRGLTSVFGIVRLGWEIEFPIAAVRCRIDGPHYAANVGTKLWPLLLAENYDRDFAL